MLKRSLNYWPEMIVFSVVALVLMVDLSPQLTWFNMAVDGTAYVMSAKWFYPAHHTSAPLYLIIGHFFTLIPLGSDYWRLGLLSVLSALVGMVFVYLIVLRLLPENKRKRWYSLLGAGLFGSTMMLISQATVVEPFTMVTALSLGAYYFSLRKNWYMVSVMIGMGLVVHHLIIFTWVALLIFVKETRNWKQIVVTLSFLAFYVYIPLSKMFSDQPNMWGNTTLIGFLTDNVFTFAGLAGGLSIWDAPKRFIESGLFLVVCFTVGIIPLAWYVFKVKLWKQPLFWMFFFPVIYAATDLDVHVSRYALPGIGFGAIIVAIALAKMKIQWLWATAAASLIMLGFNANYFDLGRTLDPNLTATKFYYEEYPRVKDGQILLNFLPGGEWEMAFYYNKNEGRHIVPVCIGMLANPSYQQILTEQGVKFETNDLDNSTDNEMEMALSIARLNPDVLITKPTNIYDYGAMIVPVLGNEKEITQWMGYKIQPKWKFIPNNPYHILTGSLELTEWQYTLQSNKNMKLVFGAFMLGVVINWILSGMPRRKKSEAEDDGSTVTPENPT